MSAGADTKDWGALAEEWLQRLSQCSEDGEGVTRFPFTAEHRAALEVLRELMRDCGLSVRLDAAGTLIGRLEGATPGAKTLLTGSHQDSVRNGGAYDGIMGVVLPALALRRLREDGVALPYSVEVMAFADEEGARFPTALMGPRVLAGTFDFSVLDRRDEDGVTLRRAMSDFGLDPDGLADLRRDSSGVLGFLECHIEQGPVLEDAGEVLGAVTAICGIERHSVVFGGRAAHAGTVPMRLRADALAGAAELVVAVETLARETEGLLATVGMLRVYPGVANAVPGSVEMSLEFRSADDGVRAGAGERAVETAEDIASRRGLSVRSERTYSQSAVACSSDLVDIFVRAIGDVGGSGMSLASGATHDTSAMADLCSVGMLFLACRGGVSHNPGEHASAADMGLGVEAFSRALVLLAEQIN